MNKIAQIDPGGLQMEIVEMNVLAFFLLVLGLGSSFIQHKANTRERARLIIKSMEDEDKKNRIA